MFVSEESEVLGTRCMYVRDGKYTILLENMKGRKILERSRFRWEQA
jgi:hypothetical protein